VAAGELRDLDLPTVPENSLCLAERIDRLAGGCELRRRIADSEHRR
jgi:hypothetical protein